MSRPETVTMRTPFPAHHISKLPKETRQQIDARKADKSLMVWKCEVCGGAHHKNAVHLDYVGHAALTDRLLDVDIAWNWEPVAFNGDGLPAFDRNGGLWIKLTVNGVTRLGYGSADGKTGGDAVKEIIGDALRNAAMRFGAALDLWHKGALHLDDEGDTAPQPANDTPVAEPKPKGWREESPLFSTPTALHKGLTRLDRELAGCGDADMVYALCSSEEWREFTRVADKHSPHYLRGGDPAPEFEGLLNTAERMIREFDTATANRVADYARV